MGLAAAEIATGQPISEARFVRTYRGGVLGRHLCKIVRNVRLNRDGGRDVPVGGGRVTLPALGKAAAIQRARKPRVNLERSIIVGNGRIELTAFQISESAAVERVGIAWSDRERGIAV